MMRRLIAIMLVAFLLPGCHDDDKPAKSAEEQRIEQEVARRVEVVKSDLKVEERGSRLRTIRVLGFVFLCSAAVFGLIWLGRPRFPNSEGRIAPALINRPPQWLDYLRRPAGRVLDLGHTPPPEPAILPPPRSQSQKFRRRRRHHETPRHS